MSAVAASMVAIPGTRAAADFADGLVGGLVGGAVSGVIVNESAKARERNRATTTTTAPRKTYRAPVNSVARQQVREEQTSLNYFGFPAGTPDGVRGRNTRNAVSQFQAHMGYPATGYLADYERVSDQLLLPRSKQWRRHHTVDCATRSGHTRVAARLS